MVNLIKYVKPFAALLFVAVALLGIQAVCDFSPEECDKYFPNASIILRILKPGHR